MIDITSPDKQQWNAAVACFSERNFLASWEYGEAQIGEVIRRIFTGQDETHAAYQAVLRDARRGRYLELSGCPLISDWDDSTIVEAVFNDLRSVAEKNSCVFVRMRPQLDDNGHNRAVIEGLGFRPSPMHLHAEHTSIIDLAQTEQDLLAGMRKKTRYEVNQATKKEVSVTRNESRESYDEFLRQQIETADRQGYVLGSIEALKNEYQELNDSGMLRLYHAYRGGQLLASAFVVFYADEADYLYGASTLEGRKYPGASAIQWQAIRDASAEGLQRYNMWGIAPPDSEGHRFAGVTTFKQGFGGQDHAYLPAHDLVIDKLRYTKNFIIEKARKKKRGL